MNLTCSPFNPHIDCNVIYVRVKQSRPPGIGPPIPQFAAFGEQDWEHGSFQETTLYYVFILKEIQELSSPHPGENWVGHRSGVDELRAEDELRAKDELRPEDELHPEDELAALGARGEAATSALKQNQIFRMAPQNLWK